MKKISFILLAVIGIIFSACENQDWEFDDYDYTTVYFAYQSPVRTLCMGEDEFDTTLDNNHQCQILATMGGVYSNDADRIIDFYVDKSLTDNLKFKDMDRDIVAMPSSYYTLSSDDKMIIKKGKLLGGVTVTLTDDFFNDPKSLTTNYVIPIVMNRVAGADSILCGVKRSGVDVPNRAIAEDWDVVPKDYIMYAIKYINKYDSNYLRRGKDIYSGAVSHVDIRHAQYVEKDEVVTSFSTRTLNTLVWDRNAKDAAGNMVPCKLLLTFDSNDKCTLYTESEGMKVSGTGQFVSKGDKKSWGNKDRDVLYLDYTLEYNGIKCATTDTLVVRDRGMKKEHFTPVLK